VKIKMREKEETTTSATGAEEEGKSGAGEPNKGIDEEWPRN
jgi:hypothetical protein